MLLYRSTLAEERGEESEAELAGEGQELAETILVSDAPTRPRGQTFNVAASFHARCVRLELKLPRVATQ
jgi:hypothetical protein